MKKEYDLKKLKKRSDKVKTYSDAAKTAISIRLDGSVLSELKTEANRLGIPYQTYIGSILYRFTKGEILDKKSAEFIKLIKDVS